jgi:hypothetical protein
MPVDPRKLKKAELIRLLNSTPLGTVITQNVVKDHVERAGYRIGDGTTVDLFRYGAWLRAERAAKRERVETGYERLKNNARARQKALSLAGRDIGELPAVVNQPRRDAAEQNFRSFCEEYFPQTFGLAWSQDHLKVISKIENAVLHGGLFAMAMPRGSGKTTLCECACVWSALYGHRNFICLIGSDEGHASDMLDSIKTELECNELLSDDFPEVIYPIHAIDGIANRCAGQLYRGNRTHIGWTAKEVVLPTIDGSKASGVIIKVAGITGRIRGMKHKRPDGGTVRPSLVVLDDPQTDESARSVSQCATRENILAGAVLGLAGPGKKIAGIMPCTVIRPGDMADNILNRDKHPQWQGERTKMVYSFPVNEKLWDRYEIVRAEGYQAERGLKDATEFYRANREAMDEGAVVAWPERFNYDELSAIQHAMNLRLQDEHAFWAEYQNEPLPDDSELEREMTADQIAAKINRMPRYSLPINCTHLTAFIDVQQNVLFYAVAAWEENFTGYIIDYGAWPEQRRPYFTAKDATPNLSQVTKGAGLEATIYAGLEGVASKVLGREYHRDDGANMRIDRCMVDANWGLSTEVVYQFCRQSSHAGVLLPSHGRYVGAASVPFAEYKRKAGDRVGHNWRIPNVLGKRQVRHVTYDTNYWKSFTVARLAVQMGDAGCLSLYGTTAHAHRLYSEHMTAEGRVRTQGRGRTVDEWRILPERSENHWFDCTVGCAVAASIQGATLVGMDAVGKKTKERVSFKELAKCRNK